MRVIIEPAILSADLARLGERAQEAERANVLVAGSSLCKRQVSVATQPSSITVEDYDNNF